MKNKLEVNEYSFHIGRTLCFAFLSDLHGHENEPILDIISQRRLDGILIGGDIIHNNEMYERGVEFLGMANKISPVFCSVGNHERKFKGDIVGMLKSTGACLLDNEYTEYKGIYIGGLSSGYKQNEKQGELKTTPEPDLAFLERFSFLEGFKLLLSHHPEYYPRYIKDKNIDLTLSGHAHGGQWRLFDRGVFSPGQGLFPKYTSGIYDRLIVGRGIGNPWPFPRINNRGEVIFLNLT